MLIALIAFVVFIISVIDTLQYRNTAGRSTARARELTDFINGVISRCRKCTLMYDVEDKRLVREIEDSGDREALTEFIQLSDRYVKDIEVLTGLLRTAVKDMNAGRTGKVAGSVELIDVYICRTEETVKGIQDITVIRPESDFSGQKTTGEGRGEDTFRKAEPPRRKKPATVFFDGCLTKEELENRFRSLSKVYHPDMKTGDADTFMKIRSEYESEKKRFTD